MTNTGTFADIAPYLTHPLVVVGLVLVLLFGTYKVLIKSGIVPQVSADTGGVIVRTILRYGFLLSVLVTVLGFGLQAYNTYQVGRTTKDAKELANVITNLNLPFSSKYKTDDLRVSWKAKNGTYSVIEAVGFDEPLKDASLSIETNGDSVFFFLEISVRSGYFIYAMKGKYIDGIIEGKLISTTDPTMPLQTVHVEAFKNETDFIILTVLTNKPKQRKIQMALKPKAV